MREFKSNQGADGRQITLYEASILDLESEAQVAIDIQLKDVDLTEYALRVYERFDGHRSNFWLEGPSCQNEARHNPERCKCYEWQRLDKEWVRYV